MDLILSPNFSLSEFTKSATARLYGIDNTPNIEQIANLQQLCIHVLQPLRDAFGTPIFISSGYRSAALNSHKAVGGAATSQHLKGQAADIQINNNIEGMEWFQWLKYSVPFDQLIIERNNKDSISFWIHVSYVAEGFNRGEIIENLIKYK